MVDAKGAAELTQPALKGGRFVGEVERIYLSHGSDEDDLVHTKDVDSEPIGSFDPKVVRK